MCIRDRDVDVEGVEGGEGGVGDGEEVFGVGVWGVGGGRHGGCWGADV